MNAPAHRLSDRARGANDAAARQGGRPPRATAGTHPARRGRHARHFEATSRLFAGSTRCPANARKNWKLALLLVRLFGRWTRCGAEASARLWLASPNTALGGRPADLCTVKGWSVSSHTWTPRAVASEAVGLRFAVWRAVEGQHVAATIALVDSLDEQHALERVLDEGKPALPPGAARLHYLLFTPFRYRPPPGGSRFRGPTDPGVFYGADEVRTACAELGYWRWRHLLDTPALWRCRRPRRVFRTSSKCGRPATTAFVRDRDRWTRPTRTRLPAACRHGARCGVGAIATSPFPIRRGGCCHRADVGRSRPAPVGSRRGSLGDARPRGMAALRRRARRRARFAADGLAMTDTGAVGGASVAIRELGRTGYGTHLACDAGVHCGAVRGTPDEIWITEHPPVYTLGLAGRREHLLRDHGVPVVRSRRTGHVSRSRPARRVYAARPAPFAHGRPRPGAAPRGLGGKLARVVVDQRVRQSVRAGVVALPPGEARSPRWVSRSAAAAPTTASA
jgi:hypothetical protein